MKTWSDLLL